MPIESIGGHKYFVTIIDDYSKMIHIAIMKAKSEVFEKFRVWKIMAENETGRKLKQVNSDNGGEYVNKWFETFLIENGIKPRRIVPYTPEQNGVAERYNRTAIEEKMKSRIENKTWILGTYPKIKM